VQTHQHHHHHHHHHHHSRSLLSLQCSQSSQHQWGWRCMKKDMTRVPLAFSSPSSSQVRPCRKPLNLALFRPPSEFLIALRH
jgi:hypothetical protein